jgi:thiol:disulfide interchange protein DsbD
MVISVFLGMYLLGKIKFAHDSDLPFISVPRFMMSLAAFVFAIYLFTGIFGADLKMISSLIPPKSASTFNFSSNNSVSESSEISSTYCGPGKYEDLFELPLGLKGYFNYEDGIACAKTKNKPIFLEFTGHFCSNCKQMENQVWPNPSVLNLLKDEFVIISLYTDDKTKLAESEWITTKNGKLLKTLGDIYKNFESENYNTIATPWYVIIDSDGNTLVSPRGKDLNITSYSAYLQSGIEAFNKK